MGLVSQGGEAHLYCGLKCAGVAPYVDRSAERYKEFEKALLALRGSAVASGGNCTHAQRDLHSVDEGMQASAEVVHRATR